MWALEGLKVRRDLTRMVLGALKQPILWMRLLLLVIAARRTRRTSSSRWWLPDPSEPLLFFKFADLRL
jgi:hypothetical protein